jgi:hypothetical protein
LIPNKEDATNEFMRMLLLHTPDNSHQKICDGESCNLGNVGGNLALK